MLSTFDQFEISITKYCNTKRIQCARTGNVYPFSHIVTLSLTNLQKYIFYIDQKCLTKQFEIYHQRMRSTFINKYFVTARSSKFNVTTELHSIKLKKVQKKTKPAKILISHPQKGFLCFWSLNLWTYWFSKVFDE